MKWEHRSIDTLIRSTLAELTSPTEIHIRMSATAPTPSFEHGPVRPRWKDCSGLTEYLREVGLFLKNFRSRLRAGEHSREPLRLLHFQFDQGIIRCDWIARNPDAWDSALPETIGRRHASLQALKDAIATRSLLFATLHEADYAQVRVYRPTSEDSFETIIAGSLRRHGGGFQHIHSLAMRAKLLGFRFKLEDEVLSPLHLDDQV